MKINEEHPAFKEFFDKWQSLATEYNEILAAIEEKNKKNNYRGRDDESSEVTKEYSRLLKELQKEYSYMYEVES